MLNDDNAKPLPDDVTQFPPAAHGAGAPPDSYARYKLLNSGDWGLTIPGGAKSGDVVLVRRKDQTESRERVGRVLWEGTGRDGKPLAIATIQRDTAPTPQRQAAAQKRQRIARRRPSPAATVAAAPVVARVTGVTTVQEAIERSRPLASQRQPIPVLKTEADINADRKALEEAAGLDEPLF